MKGYLLLEDGTLFTGRSFGHDGAKGGEVVFNTAMTGYQEILTDPSYAGQIVLMTYPLIGNYGVNDVDIESRGIFLAGFVVREYTESYSNYRATRSLADYLVENQIVGIEGVDTRALTRKIRSLGAPRAMIGSGSCSLDELKRQLKDVPPMSGQNLVSRVACAKPYPWKVDSNGKESDLDGRHVVVIDCGVKYNILRLLVDEGARVTVVPPTVSAEEIQELQPHGLLLSNGPGDPDAVPGLPAAIRNLFGTVPMLGICLGHQILALAAGAKTYKLKFGHHGANHPVRNETTGRIEITSQNHGFSVDRENLLALDGKDFGAVKLTHVHLSDGTVEGFELPDVQVQAIQYHPEANPGPRDASYLFEEFLGCIEKR